MVVALFAVCHPHAGIRGDATIYVMRALVDQLVRLDLERHDVFTPWRPAADDDRPQVAQAAVDAPCARPNAPGLLILPQDAGAKLRTGLVWPLPEPLFRVQRYASADERLRIDAFAVVPCGAILPR